MENQSGRPVYRTKQRNETNWESRQTRCYSTYIMHVVMGQRILGWCLHTFITCGNTEWLSSLLTDPSAYTQAFGSLFAAMIDLRRKAWGRRPILAIEISQSLDVINQ
jgi:hypothetical protein